MRKVTLLTTNEVTKVKDLEFGQPYYPQTYSVVAKNKSLAFYAYYTDYFKESTSFSFPFVSMILIMLYLSFNEGLLKAGCCKCSYSTRIFKRCGTGIYETSILALKLVSEVN